MRLEAHEEQLIRQIRTPLDRDDLQQSIMRITEQEVFTQINTNAAYPTIYEAFLEMKLKIRFFS